MTKWLQFGGRRPAIWQAMTLALVCLVAIAGIGQAAHLHRGASAPYSNHHCSLCAGVHVAPAVSAGLVLAPPTATLAHVEGADVNEGGTPLAYSLYVRPPPAG